MDKMADVVLKCSEPFEVKEIYKSSVKPMEEIASPARAALWPVKDPFDDFCVSWIQLTNQTLAPFCSQFLKTLRNTFGVLPAFLSKFETRGVTGKHMQEHVAREFRSQGFERKLSVTSVVV